MGSRTDRAVLLAYSPPPVSGLQHISPAAVMRCLYRIRTPRAPKFQYDGLHNSVMAMTEFAVPAVTRVTAVTGLAVTDAPGVMAVMDGCARRHGRDGCFAITAVTDGRDDYSEMNVMVGFAALCAPKAPNRRQTIAPNRGGAKQAPNEAPIRGGAKQLFP